MSARYHTVGGYPNTDPYYISREDEMRLEMRAMQDAFTTMLATLHEVSDYLDGLVDVVDGPEGTQLPNKAMSLKQEVDEAIALAEDK